jgi:hypothetical protein
MAESQQKVGLDCHWQKQWSGQVYQFTALAAVPLRSRPHEYKPPVRDGRWGNVQPHSQWLRACVGLITRKPSLAS